MPHNRLTSLLDTRQSADQFGFRPGVGVEHALLVLETVIGKSMDWNFDLWMASLDLRKAFDKIEYDSLFGVLRAQGVPLEYVDQLASLDQNQTGAVERNAAFPIQSGVKQGDVLSPAVAA